MQNLSTVRLSSLAALAIVEAFDDLNACERALAAPYIKEGERLPQCWCADPACRKAQRDEESAEMDRMHADIWDDVEYWEYVASWQGRLAKVASLPEPARVDTGRIVSVEWEYETGHRIWTKVDEGHLEWEIWWHAGCGTSLSDIDG